MPPHRDTKGMQYIYITTTGRVSGEPREIEIWFVEDEGRYYALSYIRERANWVCGTCAATRRCACGWEGGRSRRGRGCSSRAAMRGRTGARSG